ncbi:hypothetical protein GALMADRAFT_143663 [Galerina marginata CBS 339.88]|uniref:Uncharacterized protein n=1 Tax=Galerina marginata (strain CBS 339.88) TaxID=685588 RepID=A0A067SW36_GALM3|nr:hypothetical protein GALMADRAFT_143663 [Galerina marginata CBS 339.88]
MSSTVIAGPRFVLPSTLASFDLETTSILAGVLQVVTYVRSTSYGCSVFSSYSTVARAPRHVPSFDFALVSSWRYLQEPRAAAESSPSTSWQRRRRSMRKMVIDSSFAPTIVSAVHYLSSNSRVYLHKYRRPEPDASLLHHTSDTISPPYSFAYLHILLYRLAHDAELTFYHRYQLSSNILPARACRRICGPRAIFEVDSQPNFDGLEDEDGTSKPRHMSLILENEVTGMVLPSFAAAMTHSFWPSSAYTVRLPLPKHHQCIHAQRRLRRHEPQSVVRRIGGDEFSCGMSRHLSSHERKRTKPP